MRDLYDALYFRIHMTVLKSTHWGSQTGSAIGDHLIKEHDMEPDDWHRMEFEHPKKLLKYASVSYFWNAFYQRTETTAKQTMWLNPCEVIILDSSLNSKSRLLNDTSSKPNGGFTWQVGLKYSLEESCFHLIMLNNNLAFGPVGPSYVGWILFISVLHFYAYVTILYLLVGAVVNLPQANSRFQRSWHVSTQKSNTNLD